MPVFEPKTGLGLGAVDVQFPVPDEVAAAVLRQIVAGSLGGYIQARVSQGAVPAAAARAEWKAASGLLDRLLSTRS